MLSLRVFFGGASGGIRSLCYAAIRGRDLGEKSQKRIVGQDVIEERAPFSEQVAMQMPPPSWAGDSQVQILWPSRCRAFFTPPVTRTARPRSWRGRPTDAKALESPHRLHMIGSGLRASAHADQQRTLEAHP